MFFVSPFSAVGTSALLFSGGADIQRKDKKFVSTQEIKNPSKTTEFPNFPPLFARKIGEKETVFGGEIGKVLNTLVPRRGV